MYLIRHVEIQGLWGELSCSIDFHPDVNFLIGSNGSGKTTVVNIIGAALGARRLLLQRLPFERVHISLAGESSEALAEVEIIRQAGVTATSFQYTITEAGGEPESYTLGNPRLQLKVPAGQKYENLQRRISTLVTMHWLSVHRAAVQSGDKEKSYESTVDIKLAQVREDFLKYSTQLSNRLQTRLWQFIDTVLLSVIDQPSFDSVATLLEDLDTELEEQTVGEMFETIWLSREQFSQKLNSFMRNLSSALQKQKTSQQLSDDEIGIFFAMRRLRMLEQQWRQTKDDQLIIQKPIDDFLAAMNGLLKRKKLKLDNSNQLIVDVGNRGTLSLEELSSGEKQLTILLGETLLQHGATSVCLADEPELSLHVAWQEQLVSSLRGLNANAQLIFATHSPDIVSAYGDRAIEMEKVLV